MNGSAKIESGAFHPGSAGVAASLIELSIAGKDLRDMDVFSKSDPFCVVFVKHQYQTKTENKYDWKEAFRTECIQNDLNPRFTKKMKIAYHFEEHQQLKFEIYDQDSMSSHLNDHDFIGSAMCSLGQIVSSTGDSGSISGLKIKLSNPQYEGNCGEIILTAEESSTCKDELELQFIGRRLEKKHWFWSPCAFLQLSRVNEGSTDYTVVHRTEYVSSSYKPRWKRFAISLSTLCNGDLDRTIKFECFDNRSNGNHSLIGEFSTTSRQLLKGPGPDNNYFCINKAKTSNTSYQNSGEIFLGYCKSQTNYSFLDYIKGGTEIACTFGIDFTGSNGDPSSPSSLHHITTCGMNQYEVAIESVGKIIEDYDTDKLFPVLGFGARLPPDGKVSHEFFVNGHPSNPYCEGISGVLSAYRECLNRVQLFGPTNFAPIIRHVGNIARGFMNGSQYFILLIVTDGIITDMDQTKKAIVEAANFPMSIIIVGVGEADFSAMEELDGDTVRLTDCRGNKACRDIVQFVPRRNFVGVESSTPQLSSKLLLAQEVLAEIPGQFLSFMKMNSIVPNADSVAPTGDSNMIPLDPEVVLNSYL